MASSDPSRPVTGYPAPPPYSHPYPPNGHSNGGAAAAYPYPAPYQRGPPNTRAAFIRRFVITVVFGSAIIFSLLLMIWLILRPRVPDVSVESLAVRNLNVSSTRQSLSGAWTVGLAILNPNKKMTVEYDHIDASVFYRSGFITEIRLAPFRQGNRELTAVNATFSAADLFVDDRVATGISADRAARGTVSFNVKLFSRVLYRRGGWRLRGRLLRVLCRDLPVTISKDGSGKMTGGARDCSVAV